MSPVRFLILLIQLMSSSSASSPGLGDQIQAALQLHKSGLAAEALVEYSRLIPMLPSGQLASTLNSNAGSILLAAGEYERARDYFAAAVDADPQSSQAHFNLAVTMSSKFNQDNEALKHCIMAVKLNDKNHKGMDFYLQYTLSSMCECAPPELTDLLYVLHIIVQRITSWEIYSRI